MSEIVGKSIKAYPCPGLDGEPGKQMVVLTLLLKRVEGTMKAYAAIVPDNSIADPDYRGVLEFVKRFGSPLRYEDAKRLWVIKPEDYAA